MFHKTIDIMQSKIQHMLHFIEYLKRMQHNYDRFQAFVAYSGILIGN